MLRLAALSELEHIAPALNTTIGCRRAVRAQAEQGLKARHRLSAPIVPKHELIEVRLKLGTAHAVMRANQPVLKIPDRAVRERYDRGGTLAQG